MGAQVLATASTVTTQNGAACDSVSHRMRLQTVTRGMGRDTTRYLPTARDQETVINRNMMSTSKVGARSKASREPNRIRNSARYTKDSSTTDQAACPSPRKAPTLVQFTDRSA